MMTGRGIESRLGKASRAQSYATLGKYAGRTLTVAGTALTLNAELHEPSNYGPQPQGVAVAVGETAVTTGVSVVVGVGGMAAVGCVAVTLGACGVAALGFGVLGAWIGDKVGERLVEPALRGSSQGGGACNWCAPTRATGTYSPSSYGARP